MIKGIAFNLEGTVVNLEQAHHGAHLKVCREVGLNFTLEEAIVAIPHFIGGPHKTIAQEIYDLGDKTQSVEWVSQRDSEYYEELLKTMPIEPRPGFSTVLFRLQDSLLQIKTSIGSLTTDEKAHFILDRSGLSKSFDPKNVVLQSHVKNLKPAPDVFLETARRMGVAPNEQLVFEDSPRGVQAAIAAGSRAIGMPVYKNRVVIMQLLDAGAERVFMDWREMKALDLIQNLNAEE